MTKFPSARSNVHLLVRSGWRSRFVAISSWLVAVSLTITAQQAGAAQCSLAVQGASFGTYDIFNNQALDSTGNIGVTCDISAPYSIALSPGGGSYASRSMSSGAYRLNYNLYTDATRTVIWGDGTGGTATVSNTGAVANHTVYGRIPARQNAYVGSFSDIVIVTLTF